MIIIDTCIEAPSKPEADLSLSMANLDPNTLSIIIPLLEAVKNGSMSSEALKPLLERVSEDMKRKEILSKYVIKQLPNNGRFYATVDGVRVKKTRREDLEKYIIDFEASKNRTLKNIFKDFLTIRKNEVAATTWQKDIKNFEMYIKNSDIASKPITELTIKDGYDFFNFCKQKKPDIKRKYWNTILCTLNAMFLYCTNNDIIKINPFINMKLNQNNFTPAIKHSNGDNVFTDRERSLVCNEALKESVKTKSAVPLGIILLFNLGIRVGELCAIKWGDFYEKNGKTFLHIQREIVNKLNSNGKLQGTIILDHCKTPSGDRELQINSEVIKTVQQILAYNKEAGYPVSDNDYIFLRKVKGEVVHCTERCFEPRLKKYCKNIGMKELKSPHDARRTALTNMLKAGMPITAIQKYAGHATLKQTLDYLKLQDDEDIADALEKISQTNANIIDFKDRSTLVEQSGTVIFLKQKTSEAM